MFSFFFSSRRRHTRWTGDWSSDVCSSDLAILAVFAGERGARRRRMVLPGGGLPGAALPGGRFRAGPVLAWLPEMKAPAALELPPNQGGGNEIEPCSGSAAVREPAAGGPQAAPHHLTVAPRARLRTSGIGLASIPAAGVRPATAAG